MVNEIKMTKGFIQARLLIIFLLLPLALFPVMPFLLGAHLDSIPNVVRFRLGLILILFTPILLYAIARIAREIYILPIGISIDTSLREMTLRFTTSRKKIAFTEVVHYTRTSYYAGGQYKSTRYRGVYIYLNNNEKYLLSELSVSDITQIVELLEKETIKYAGEETYKIFYSHLRNNK